MLNIPEYKEYGGETKIALMDNSSLAFMHELSQRSYPSDGILSVYDLILIPKWVMEEIEDSTYRSTYVEQLQAKGYIHQRFLQVLQIVFGKVVLVSSLAVDWPFGVGLRLYINQRKTTMIGHSTGRRITMKPLFPEKFLMQPIICGHPAIIQRKTDPCPC